MNSQEEFSEALQDGLTFVCGKNKLYMDMETGVIRLIGPGLSSSGINLKYSDDEDFVRLIGRSGESHVAIYIPDWELEA